MWPMSQAGSTHCLLVNFVVAFARIVACRETFSRDMLLPRECRHPILRHRFEFIFLYKIQNIEKIKKAEKFKIPGNQNQYRKIEKRRKYHEIKSGRLNSGLN